MGAASGDRGSQAIWRCRLAGRPALAAESAACTRGREAAFAGGHSPILLLVRPGETGEAGDHESIACSLAVRPAACLTSAHGWTERRRCYRHGTSGWAAK